MTYIKYCKQNGGNMEIFNKIEWKAYCLYCKKEIYSAPNGNFVDIMAKNHTKDSGHRVIVGYEVENGIYPEREVSHEL